MFVPVMRGVFLVFAVVFFPSLSVWADEIKASGEIRAVTVYSSRAMVTRQAKVAIPAGSHKLVLTGLPLSIDVNSLRVQGQAQAAVTLGALSYKRESYEDYVVPREKELNAQLVTLQDQRQVFQVEKQALKSGRDFLENLGKQAALRSNEDIAAIDLNPESWAKAADSISAKMSENMKNDHSLDIKTREIDEKIQKVQNELRDLHTGQKQNYSVSIPFDSERATTLHVDLSYQISNVGWSPIYDARLNTKTGQMELVQYGSVWQRTGEDWHDVALSLSTAQPSRGAGLPELAPKWVDLRQPYAQKGEAKFSADAEEEMDAASAPYQDARVQSAQIETNGFVGEYNIVGPASVAADGTQAKLLIGTFETDSTLEVQVKPQLSNNAYLVAKTTLKGEVPILPGQVHLFRDGAYIGKAYLPMLRPEDARDLAFGIDDNVTAERRTLKDESSELGLISKERMIARHFVTDIKNLHKKKIDIVVLEAVPVSKDKKIRVEIIEEATTAGYERDVDDVKGVTRWKMALEPQQSAKIKLGWKVSWPKDENISGL